MIVFEKLGEQHLEQVLDWRTSEHVTQFMYTDIEKNIHNQRAWFKKIKDDTSQVNFIIKYNEHNIGLISLNNINLTNKSATSGFYIGDLKFSMVASRILPYFLNYTFFEKKLNKLYIEVMDTNKNMLQMDYHYGFRHVGTLQQHIYKNDRYHNVEILELLSSEWKENFQKYHKLKAEIKGE